MDLKITKDNEKYIVYIDEEKLGYIEKYYNAFHCHNCYLNLNLNTYNTTISKHIFLEINSHEKKSLQIMLYSDEKDKISFIEKAGFTCKRRCYEIEASISNLTYLAHHKVNIKKCHSGDNTYIHCSKIIYKHYQKTHANINPLSINFNEFISALPDTVFYYSLNNEIAGVIFIEENEIAYSHFKEDKYTLDFIYAVVSRLFTKYNKIFYEADDIDISAMKFCDVFNIELIKSYNTYLKPYI